MIQVRYSTSPSSVETAHAADLRENFLVADLFEAGEVHAVYTHDDRLVVGGAVPADGQLDLPAWSEVLGVAVSEPGLRYGAEGEGPSIYLEDPEGNRIELKGLSWPQT